MEKLIQGYRGDNCFLVFKLKNYRFWTYCPNEDYYFTSTNGVSPTQNGWLEVVIEDTLLEWKE